MKLHYSQGSPFVRKVMACAILRGIDGRIDTVPIDAHASPPELLKDNPLSKVPCLVADDGTPVFDSPVICEYLDSVGSAPKLFPAAWPERLVALRRHALGQGMLDNALPLLAEGFRPAEKQSEPHKELWRAKLRACVEALEQEADDLAAGAFTVGHLTIGAALGYLDFRFADLRWREGRPRLAAWHEAFNARPAVQANMSVDDR